VACLIHWLLLWHNFQRHLHRLQAPASTSAPTTDAHVTWEAQALSHVHTAPRDSSSALMLDSALGRTALTLPVAAVPSLVSAPGHIASTTHAAPESSLAPVPGVALAQTVPRHDSLP
jgi:hypothetical protein